MRGEREFGESRVAGNLWRYALRTVQIIFRCYRDYHPLRFFGGIGLAFAVPALLLAGFLGFHYIATGGFSPHKWAGFTSAVLMGVALVCFHIGVIGDMLTRHRVYLEELLYRQRDQSRRLMVDLFLQGVDLAVGLADLACKFLVAVDQRLGGLMDRAFHQPAHLHQQSLQLLQVAVEGGRDMFILYHGPYPMRPEI